MKKKHTKLDHIVNIIMSFKKHRNMSGKNHQKLSTQFASQEGNWGPEDEMGETFSSYAFLYVFDFELSKFTVIHK